MTVEFILVVLVAGLTMLVNLRVSILKDRIKELEDKNNVNKI